MASGEIQVTPGRVLSDEELVDNQKLNELGTPTLRIKELTITARELADGAINSDKLSVDLEAQIGVADNSVTTNKLVDGAVTSNKMAENARIPIGGLLDFAGATAPDGWLLCGGQAISRTTYLALFGVISTTWGAGDGTTTFNVPDLRGYVCAGKDNMMGGAAGRLTGSYITGGGGPNALGGFGGVQAHTLSTAEIPNHVHAYSVVGGSGGIAAGAGFGQVSQNSSGAGGGGAHTNCQPTRIVNKMIRYL